VARVRPPAPPTTCGTADGHVHYLSDPDGGTALVCCHDSERTYPLAYLAGRVERYRDKEDVVQCATRAELKAAESAHRTTTHAVITPVR
jgi:hypothetical protein